MKVIYPNFGRFFWPEIRRLIIILLIASVYVFFRWKFQNHPHLSLRFGLVGFGALVFLLFPFRWFLLVPRTIEINEAVVAFCFYFRNRIFFSFEDIDKCYSQGMGIFNIKLKNGRLIKVLPSAYSPQQWTQLLHILNSHSLKKGEV